MKTPVGIIGGAGYTAGELIRLLLTHPHVEIQFVHSASQAGHCISAIHSDLVGDTNLRFTDRVDFDAVEVLFLCQGHGKAQAFLGQHTLPADVKLVDLSRDFRLQAEGNPFMYGLPELNRDQIRDHTHIANPGCFATCIQLALLPFACHHLLPQTVHIHAITGATGAGQQPSPTTHFSWRNNNISVYKAFTHQHLDEIRQSLRQLQPQIDSALYFIPLRGDFARGIHSSIHFECLKDLDSVYEIIATYFDTHPFVHIQNELPYLKQVINTNKCIIGIEKHQDQILVVSVIDNLLKGASGQAVQNMNLMMGWEETAGLQLKASAF